MNKKNVLIITLVILVGLIMIGGTYAYLSNNADVTNGTYNITSNCFTIDYTDNTNLLTGTLFPSAGPAKGLSGSVTMKINDLCSVNGTGSLILHVNSNTSTKFGTLLAEHCENPSTLQTLEDYTTSSNCTSNGGTWITSGTALKYIVYDNPSFSGTPLAKNCFYNTLIGNEAAIYADFPVTKTAKTYYIYIWLDGYLSDNTYTNLTFDGYIRAEATQNED